MLNYHTSLEILKSHISNIELNSINIPISDSTGYVLSEDIISDVNLPPFTNSAMDGFAVKFNENIKSWVVIGEISAGNFTDFLLDENTTVSIMTGGKLPLNADTIIPIEDVRIYNDKIELLDRVKFKKGNHVRYMGDDLKINSIAIPANTLIKPQNIGLAASCGQSLLKVKSPLKFSILATGDELVSIDEKPENDKIRTSNTYSLESAIRNINMLIENSIVSTDDRDKIKKSLHLLLNDDSDIILTTGGVSVGKYDIIQEILVELGAEVIFWKVNIKPGKPLLFCKFTGKKTKYIIGLPGNPVSAFVGFHIFIMPVLLSIYKLPDERYIKGFFMDTYRKIDGKRHFVRAIVNFDMDRSAFIVHKSGPQSSGNLAGLNFSNCLVEIDEETEFVEMGEMVKCIMI